MHPMHHAEAVPDKAACIVAETGETITYYDLDRRSNRGAHLLRAFGVAPGDVVAAMLDNEPAVFEIAWATQRTGAYLTSVSTKLSLADLIYILRDSEARLLIVSNPYVATAAAILEALPDLRCLTVNAVGDRFPDWTTVAAQFPDTPIADEAPGTEMLYSSGTTGRPKGVKPPLPQGPLDAPTPIFSMGQALYGMNADMVYLSTSPLYHAAPLRWAMTVQRFGGTVILMSRFDAEKGLAYIERYRVTHSTWVPTHFIRLLKLPPEVRARYDTSSMVAAIHAAAPCPVPVKQAMIAWWGPIIHEYYSGTEQCGITALSTEEWLRKPGSVGRAVLGQVRIVDDEGRELPTGEAGNVYFADGPRFEYHRDPAKTSKAYNDRGWATLGDVGYLDADGYLFLTDRKDFMIISGGVNIYPQEIESLLVTHPKVADAAVIGEPDEEMGERVVAIVQPVPGVTADAALAEELGVFARAELGGVKTPRRFDFRSELPREPTGKLLKAKLIAEYRDPANRSQ